jgi:hypothetical protein
MITETAGQEAGVAGAAVPAAVGAAFADVGWVAECSETSIAGQITVSTAPGGASARAA